MPSSAISANLPNPHLAQATSSDNTIHAARIVHPPPALTHRASSSYSDTSREASDTPSGEVAKLNGHSLQQSSPPSPFLPHAFAELRRVARHASQLGHYEDEHRLAAPTEPRIKAALDECSYPSASGLFTRSSKPAVGEGDRSTRPGLRRASSPRLARSKRDAEAHRAVRAGTDGFGFDFGQDGGRAAISTRRDVRDSMSFSLSSPTPHPAPFLALQQGGHSSAIKTEQRTTEGGEEDNSASEEEEDDARRDVQDGVPAGDGPSSEQAGAASGGQGGAQRSRAGCLTCRRRKVKCDEVRPRCGKCAIKSREGRTKAESQCIWPDPRARRNKKRDSSVLDALDSANGIDTPFTSLEKHMHPQSTSHRHRQGALALPRPDSFLASVGTSLDGFALAASAPFGEPHGHGHGHGHGAGQSKLGGPSGGVSTGFSPTTGFTMGLGATGSELRRTAPSASFSGAPPSGRLNTLDPSSLHLDSVSLPNLAPFDLSANHQSLQHGLDPLPNLPDLPLGPQGIDGDADWFSLLFGSSTDTLSTQPAPSFPPLHFHPPPLPPPTRFYVPPDFLPKHVLNAGELDEAGYEDLSRVVIRPDRRAEMMADPAFLAPYFPNLDERLVMRHYLRKTVNIIIAFECPRRPWNPWINIHAPLAFNHLPGVNPAADALRAAMVAVGSVHLRFTHDPTDQRGAWAIVRAAKGRVLSLVRKSIDAQEATNTPLDKGDVELILAALLSCTIASSLAADDSWHELLTSVLSLVERLGGAARLIKEGGSACDGIQSQNQSQLAHQHGQPQTQAWVEGQTQMSSFRFFLEQLAIRDVFGCMTTELAPSILNVAFSPWFFEAEAWSRGDDEWESIERMFGISRGMVDVIARACTLISQVRRSGISLPEDMSADSGWGSNGDQFTLRLPHKVQARLGRSRDREGDEDDDMDGLDADRAGEHIKQASAAGSGSLPLSHSHSHSPAPILRLDDVVSGVRGSGLDDGLKPQGRAGHASTRPEGSGGTTNPGDKMLGLGNVPAHPPGSASAAVALRAEVLHSANGLIAELGVWDKSSNFTPFHPRTQYGNHAYRHAIKIRLLREVFLVPKEDARVQASIGAIVELTVELLAQYGRITWLTWPIVLAAFNMLPEDPQRGVALTLLNEFTYHACFDLIAARNMLCEFWEEEDAEAAAALAAAQGRGGGPASVPSAGGSVVGAGKKKRARPFLD